MQRKESRNKTATLPTGSGHAGRASPARESQSAFIARALAARGEARRTGEYFAADEVLRELDALHARAPAGPGT